MGAAATGCTYQASGADPVPDSIFDQDGRATLTLLIALDSQSTRSQPAWPVRKVLSFNNCAVVGDGIDPGSVAVVAEAVGAGERKASVDQGKVGFALDLTRPRRTSRTAEDALRNSIASSAISSSSRPRSTPPPRGSRSRRWSRRAAPTCGISSG